jgi:hypothetical protein
MSQHFVFTGEIRPAKAGELVGSSDGVFRLRADSDVPYAIYRAVDCVTQSTRGPELERENAILRAAVEEVVKRRESSLLEVLFGLTSSIDAARAALARLDNPEYCP